MRKNLFHTVFWVFTAALFVSCTKTDKDADGIKLNDTDIQTIACAYLSREDLVDHGRHTIVLAVTNECDGAPTTACLRHFVQFSFCEEQCTAFRYVYAPANRDYEFMTPTTDLALSDKDHIDFAVTSIDPFEISLDFRLEGIVLEDCINDGVSLRTTVSGRYRGRVKSEPIGGAFWYTPLSNFVSFE